MRIRKIGRRARSGEGRSPIRTAAALAGSTSIGVLSLLLNPLFVAPVIGVAALVVKRRHDASVSTDAPASLATVASEPSQSEADA